MKKSSTSQQIWSLKRHQWLGWADSKMLTHPCSFMAGRGRQWSSRLKGSMSQQAKYDPTSESRAVNAMMHTWWLKGAATWKTSHLLLQEACGARLVPWRCPIGVQPCSARSTFQENSSQGMDLSRVRQRSALPRQSHSCTATFVSSVGRYNLQACTVYSRACAVDFLEMSVRSTKNTVVED